MSLSPPTNRHPDHAVEPQFPARWSPRALTDAAVSASDVQRLLEAARWAPSASNHQPARFVWALRGEAAFAAIAGALVPFNQDWAGKAAALIVVASRDVSTGKDGREVPNRWSAFDAGAAWMSLALQARAMGLVSHAMGGFDIATLAKAVSLPPDHTLHAVVAVGHQGPAEGLPEGLRGREQPSLRHPITDTAMHGAFGV